MITSKVRIKEQEGWVVDEYRKMLDYMSVYIFLERSLL